ncbi:MAG: hypothetical protein JSS10_02130 [Verrucomicrobia bacterium]|nr:hypothetical protein [Verrucomicrobiota bacterium]
MKRELDKLVNLEVLDSQATTDQARKLREIAEEFRDAVCSLQNQGTTLADVLRGKEIPFPFAYRMLEILTKPEIQCFHSLKKELSKTTLIFLEFVVFQSGLEEQSFYTETVDEMKKRLNTVLSTLPENEVETRFNVRCAQAAVQKLDKGIGKWKEVAKDNSKAVIGGVIKTLLCAGAPSPEMATALVGPLINLSVAIYENLEEPWYKDVWGLRWHCGGNRMITQAHLEATKPLMEKFGDTLAGSDYYLSFCISQIFIQIFKNPSAEEPLRKAVFEGERTSLLNLAHLNDEDQLGDNSFWKTRYVTLIHLRSIAEDRNDSNKPYRLKSIEAILRQWQREKARVKILAGSIICSLAPANHAEWQEKWNHLKPEKTVLLNKVKGFFEDHSSLKSKLDEKKRDVEEVKKAIQQARQPQQQSTGGSPSLNPAVLEAGLQEFEKEKDFLEQQLYQVEKDQAMAEQALKLCDVQSEKDWEQFRI